MPSIVFAFHGCGQNAKIFRSLIKNIRFKRLGLTQSEPVVRNAPYSLGSNKFSWYSRADQKVCYKRPLPPGTHVLTKLVRNINEEAKRANADSVILTGFSQGAMVALDLAARFADQLPPIKGVISVGPPHFQEPDPYRGATSPVKVILVTSPQDRDVGQKESLRWLAHFDQVRQFVTDRGHKCYFPGAFRSLVRSFF